MSLIPQHMSMNEAQFLVLVIAAAFVTLFFIVRQSRSSAQ
jgi:hypothetical protein